jgi:hypothetical protein
VVIKLHHPRSSRQQGGYALLLVLVFTGITLFALATAMEWSSSRAIRDERQGRFQRTQAAAEAAVSRVAGRIAQDYRAGGVEAVAGQLDDYRRFVPTKREHPIWGEFSFSDNHGQANRTHVAVKLPWTYGEVAGLPGRGEGYRTVLRIESEAREADQKTAVAAAVEQEVELATVPLGFYSVFYEMDLEIHPPTSMTIDGRVHSNGSLYSRPSGVVRFIGSVSASGEVLGRAHPADPVIRNHSRAYYSMGKTSGLRAASPNPQARLDGQSLRALLEVPDGKDSSYSQLSSQFRSTQKASNDRLEAQRFYRQADLAIVITDKGMSATSGGDDRFSVNIPKSVIDEFVKENRRFYDMREERYARATELDMQKLLVQLPVLTLYLRRTPRVIYLADLSSTAKSEFAAVRIVNGKVLPPGGLTLATPNPLYVQGDFNMGDRVTLGSGDKKTVIDIPPAPVCLAADAVTLLSNNWRDNDSNRRLSFRKAESTTLHAAIITGIVPTRSGYYSGGLENTIRLLENWSAATFTFKGTIAVLFESAVATAPWGATAEVFDSPYWRNWTFPARLRGTDLPAGMPDVMMVTATRPQLAAVRDGK